MNPWFSRLLLILVFGGVPGSLFAQQTVILSKPTGEVADQANSFLGDPKHQLNAGSYNAPRELFKDYTPDLPMPRPLFLNNQNQDPSVQDALNRRKNWTMLTPEQIYGNQTPEDILGVNKDSPEKKLSLPEQFLLRQSQSAAIAATNGKTAAISWRDNDNPFAKKSDEQNPFSRSSFSQTQDQKMQSGSTRSLSQLFNLKPGSGFSSDDRQQQSAWTSVFAQPPRPKATPDQIADLERFRAMLEPTSQPDKLANPTRFSADVTPPPDPYLQAQPKFNPNGHSYNSLQNESARPIGINPLPGITGPVLKPVAKKPSWEAQLPPWLSDGPKAHDASRNF